MNDEGDSVFKDINEANNINVYMFHNALWHAKYIKAFPDIKIIHIDRHPVDLVYSWYKRGYGDSFYDKERTALTLLEIVGFEYRTMRITGKMSITLDELDRVIK